LAAEIFELIENGAYAVSGWRYLLSPSFRLQTHKRWQAKGRAWVVIDVFMAGVGMVFTGFLVWLFVRAAS
jgi:hypothetical protein